MSSEDLKKIFDESIGSTKAYFISKVQQKHPILDKKDIEVWLKSQEVVQVNTKVKGINLKITTKSRTFQIDIIFYKIEQSLKPFLLLVDIMSHKSFWYSIPGEKNMTKIITTYNKFLQEVDYVKAVEGDGEFENTGFKKLNEVKGIQVYTNVAKDNHFTSGNKLGIIDRLTRTLKENIREYRVSVGTLGNLQNMIDTVVNMYNDSPHRGISGKTPNQMWDNIFDKGNAQFSQEIYEIHDRIGYSYKIDWSVCLLAFKHLVYLQARIRPSVQAELDLHTSDRWEERDRKKKKCYICSLKHLPNKRRLAIVFFFSGFTEVVCVCIHYRSVSVCVYSTIVCHILFTPATLLDVCVLLSFAALYTYRLNYFIVTIGK